MANIGCGFLLFLIFHQSTSSKYCRYWLWRNLALQQ